ncbi:MAG: VWA domain-containing protein [Kiritimatiellae bacterium]|nr:VWA domain-containing protein [Kiritimatiellia bacterium]
MSVEFEYPWLLILVWFVPVLVVWWVFLWKRSGETLARFIAPALQQKLCPVQHRGRTIWQIALVGAAVCLMVIAAARPKWGKSEQTLFTRGRDLMITLDVSRSMLANDVHPSRLQRAKTDILDLIRELRGDRAGLIAFRQKAVLVCPLTTDYAFLRQAVDAVDIDSAPRGETDIGDAIHKALDAFEDELNAHKAIILISDGEDLSGRALVEAERAAEKGIVIFTVGIGAAGGTQIPDPANPGSYFSYQGSNIVTRLNNETLYNIAKMTGGAYIPVATSGMAGTTLGTIYDNHLRRVAAQELEETLQSRLIERYQLFLLPAFLLLLAACCFSRGRLRVRSISAASASDESRLSTSIGPAKLKNLSPPKQAIKSLSLLICMVLACRQVAADGTNTVASTNAIVEASVEEPPGAAGRSGARAAQRLYRLGMYEKAAKAFMDSARGSGRSLERNARYNAAIAYYKAGNFEKAAETLSVLDAQRAKVDSEVAMGLGSALHAQALEQQEETADAFEKKAELLTASAEAFKLAAREGNRPAASGNLAHLVEQLPKLKTEAKIARLNETYQKQGPFDLIAKMLLGQRDINEKLQIANTNDLPQRIRALESLAEKQDANADLWIPLKGKLLSALAQQGDSEELQQQMARMAEGIELTRDSMQGTARMMRDARVDDANAARVDENAVYGFWKMLAPCSPVVEEALARQTNAIQETTRGLMDVTVAQEALPTALNDQVETKALTDLFIERFEVEFPENPPRQQMPAVQGQAGAPQAEAPQLTPEDRAKIKDLAAQASLKQEEAFEKLSKGDAGAALVEEEASHELLKQIHELLPRQQQQQQGEDQQEQQQGEEEQQEQQGEEEQQEQQPEEQQGEEQQEEEQQPEEQEGAETNALPEDVKELLKKALEREQEHAAEKRRQNRMIPMLPHEKDW